MAVQCIPATTRSKREYGGQSLLLNELGGFSVDSYCDDEGAGSLTRKALRTHSSTNDQQSFYIRLIP